MNILLWILQVLLALHTLIGALWKVSNAAQILPFPNPIPEIGWYLLIALEIFCAVALILPAFKKNLGHWVPRAALVIAAEMILFSALQLSAGYQDYTPMTYWLVTAGVCVFIAWARHFRKPIR